MERASPQGTSYTRQQRGPAQYRHRADTSTLQRYNLLRAHSAAIWLLNSCQGRCWSMCWRMCPSVSGARMRMSVPGPCCMIPVIFGAKQMLINTQSPPLQDQGCNRVPRLAPAPITAQPAAVAGTTVPQCIWHTSLIMKCSTCSEVHHDHLIISKAWQCRRPASQ